MDTPWIGRRGWYAAFDKQPYFVTTFAPCYPSSHARFAHGVPHGYVLFQPDQSFDRHKLVPHHPDDDSFDTIRQKIRKNFRAHGRPYWLPPGRFFPLGPQVVRPLNDTGFEQTLEWWKSPAQKEKERLEKEALRSSPAAVTAN